MDETLWAPVAGKYGRTRDGRLVGPMYVPFAGSRLLSSNGYSWHKDGRHDPDRASPLDLVAEWPVDNQGLAILKTSPAQTIDISKIRVGDKVRLGGDFEVLRCDPKDKSRPVCVRMFGDLVAWLHVSTIAEHLPAAIIDPGNRVVFNGREWDVVAIKDAVGGRRAILFDEMTDNIGFPMVSELTRIDGEAG